MSTYTFIEKLNKVRSEAIDYIQNYTGSKSIILPTGERAIDNDDAWIIIGDEEVGEPYLRDKREQRLREKYKAEGIEFSEELSSDVYMLDNMENEELCMFADELAQKG